MDHWLARAAAMRPDREAVGGLTYAQLLDAGGSAAGALIERGVAPGDRVALALGSAVALGLDQSERWLCPMPLAHVGGLSILLRSAVYTTTVVLHGRFDTDTVGAALSDPVERITLVSLVPTMLSRLLDAGL